MRHKVAGRKLNRNSSHRRALARSLIRGIIAEFDGKGFIVTTRPKAKFAQPKVERLITLARTKNLHNIRRAMAVVQDRELVSKLFDEIAPYYSSRPGGYTRVLRLPTRRLGDAAELAYFGFVRDDKPVEGEAAPGEAAAKAGESDTD